MRTRIVIDPGHGGGRDRGKSTATGARGPMGTLERDVTLGIARAVVRQLGGAGRLTRTADDNPPLAERSAMVRACGAAMFVSVHANAGPRGARGAEVWIHDRADARSAALGKSIASALGGTVHAGTLAVLDPAALGPGTAACLVEVEYLSHPDGERVLASRDGQNRTAHAISRAVIEHDRPPRFGAVPTFVDVDASGLLWIPRWQPDWEVGFLDAAGVAHVGVVDGRPVENLSLAGVGVLTSADKPHGDSILLVEEVALTPTAVGGAPAGFTRMDLRLTRRRQGWTWIGHQAIVEPTRRSFEPIAPARLDAALVAILDERARIDLLDGPMWIWMSFSLADEAVDTVRWVPPGHTRDEIDFHTAAINAEIANLPAGTPSQASATANRNIMVGVAAHEGSFGAASGAGDTHASLGLFQWAMEKGQTAESGSLGRFFRDLEARANAARAAPGAEGQLFVDAFAECTAAGLSLAGNQIQIDAAAATGEDVEARMRPHMAAGRLRTYQLVAANDWIEQFRTTAIRPGPSVGRRIVGNGYTQTDGAGLRATLTFRGSTFECDAKLFRTVGELMGTTKALANAITLGVNRPHFVEAAAWKVMSPATAITDITDSLRDLADELTNHGANPLPMRVTRAMVQASTPMAHIWYQAIEQLLWPLGVPGVDDEWRTVAAFRRHALKFYNADDARRFHREQRFSTLELMTW